MLALVAVALTGCGASSATTSTSSTATPVRARTVRAAEVKYVKCLRRHGLNVPLPPAPGAHRTSKGRPAVGRYPPAKRQRAVRACIGYLRAVIRPATPAQLARVHARLLNFAKCMRAHGVKLPNPKRGPLGGYGFGGALTKLVQSAAYRTCLRTLVVTHTDAGGG